MSKAPNADPVAYANLARFSFSDAKRGSVDPSIIKLAEGLEQLAIAVAVIADRQTLTNVGVKTLVQNSREG